MLPKLEHFPVNWIDGMNITSKHLIDLENSISDHIRDSMAAGLNTFNYGLLPSNAPDFNVQIIPEQNQTVRVQVFNCRAVTGAGCRIEIINDQLKVATSLSALREKYNLPREKELEFLVVLSVNLFKRQKYGEPSPEEGFTRPPYTTPTYQLSIEPSHLFASRPGDGEVPFTSSDFESFSLIIGRLFCRADQLIEDKTYIPACASVNSHVALAGWASEMEKILAEIQRDAIEIVKRVCEKRNSSDVKEDVRPLAELIRDWAQQLAEQLNAPLNQLHFTGRQLPPIHLIEAITLATRRAQTTISCLNHPNAQYGGSQMGEEKILSYFNEWTSITPDNFREALRQVIDHPYIHSDIRPQLNAISICWNNMYRVVRELLTLDYIGQGKEDWQIRRRSTVTDRQNLPRENVTSAAVDELSYSLTRRRS